MTVADELDEVLTRAFVPPPYILVGHSLGGLYVQAYARSRPRKVAAVVLIDATTEAQRRGGETIMSMGMAGALAQRWAGVNNRAPAVQYCRVFGGRPFAVRSPRILERESGF